MTPCHRLRVGIPVGLAVVLFSSALQAQETVRVDLPASVSFHVSDVSRSTVGAPQPTPVAFSDAQLASMHRLRISVKADSVVFAAPGGAEIPASNVSWSTSGALGGSGAAGTVSSTAYGLVFESSVATSSGSVDVTWTLAPPPAGVRAGEHRLTLRWKIESITP